MKKLLPLFLAVVLLLSLPGCGQSPAPVEPTATATEEPAPTVTPEPTPEPAPILAASDIAEGIYTAQLSGCSYYRSDSPDTYSMEPTILPAELTVIIEDGTVRLYCAAIVSSGGTVLGVDTPRSPTYTQTVSGTLPLSQDGAGGLIAQGDLTTFGEGIRLSWDANTVFSGWEVTVKDNKYSCSVSIALVDDAPVADIAIDGSLSRRSCSLPLSLTPLDTDADAPYLLWTNGNDGQPQTPAKDYYVMFPLPDCRVTELETDHRLSGGMEPGQISLFGEDGSEYGPFQAVGRPGPGGEANAYWAVEVDIELPAGRYFVADSDDSTWSSNEASGGWGIAAVRGRLR